MDELISVIIPVYNVKEYLNRCLESVVNQTYKNLDIILVDDGSTDGSSELCDEWEKQDKRIRVVHKKNEGQSKARNLGLDMVLGKYVGFVDSDDWIDLDFFEYLYKIIKTYSVDVAFCDFVRLKKPIRKKKRKERISIRENQELDNYFYRLNGEKSSYALWCGLYKWSTVSNLRFLENKNNEDVLYRYELYQKCRRIAFSDLIKYNYFINNVGVTIGKLNKKDFALLEIWDEIVKREKDKENYNNALLNRARAAFTLYTKYLLKGNCDVDKTDINNWHNEIKQNYKILKKGKMLDWKRKIILFLVTRF